MEEVLEYLRKCGIFYLATMDGDQPRVRPFSAATIFEDKLYIETGRVKKVFTQMIKNPKIEISGMADESSWIRIEATVVRDDRLEARQYMIDKNPGLKSMYAADDGNFEVLYLKNATATINPFSSEPKIIKF